MSSFAKRQQVTSLTAPKKRTEKSSHSRGRYLKPSRFLILKSDTVLGEERSSLVLGTRRTSIFDLTVPFDLNLACFEIQLS
jgi:hypothetical protein